MKLYKYRVVADRCPLKKRDCNKCKYNNGFDFGMKTYCGYNDDEFREVWNLPKRKKQK